MDYLLIATITRTETPITIIIIIFVFNPEVSDDDDCPEGLLSVLVTVLLTTNELLITLKPEFHSLFVIEF